MKYLYLSINAYLRHRLIIILYMSKNDLGHLGSNEESYPKTKYSMFNFFI